MTGRRLYERYTDALAATKATRWDRDRQQNVLSYPPEKPVAWGFLTDPQRGTWNTLARWLTASRRKRTAAA